MLLGLWEKYLPPPLFADIEERERDHQLFRERMLIPFGRRQIPDDRTKPVHLHDKPDLYPFAGHEGVEDIPEP